MVSTLDVTLYADILNSKHTTAVTASDKSTSAVTTIDDAAGIENQVLNCSVRTDTEETKLLGGSDNRHVFHAETLAVERAVVAVGIITNRDKGVVAQIQILSQLGTGITMSIVDIVHKPVVLLLGCDEIIITLFSEEIHLQVVTY